MSTVSIIVPIYKVEDYIRECIDSILAQTYPDFELILVDDGSPDDCGRICDDYAEEDDRIKVVHKKNGGLTSARNAGLEALQREGYERLAKTFTMRQTLLIYEYLGEP